LTEEPGLPPPVAKTNHLADASADAGLKTAGKFHKTDAKPAENKNSSTTAAKTDEDSDDALDEKVPNVDIPLEEAKRILTDYVVLFSKQKGLAVTGDKK